MAARQTFGFLIPIALVLTGCLQQGRPPVAERSVSSQQREVRVSRPVLATKPALRVPVQDTSSTATGSAGSNSIYAVRRGDTLYSIAWRFGLDPQKLAYANRIRPPYTIYPGQRLELREVVPPLRSALEDRQKQRADAPGKRPQKPAEATVSAAQNQDWQWPVPFKPQQGFGGSNKGVDFELPIAAPVSVVASNPGKVVYAGNGIGGFEQLIIIKHTEKLLSAYSFNGQISVAEQSAVKAGQKVADILSVGRTQQKLHFEIRRDGTPINPEKFIK